MKKYLISILLITSYSLFPQTTLNNLKEIADFGIKNSIEYKSSTIDFIESKDNLSGFFIIDSTEVSAELNYSENNNMELESSINIPIIEQLSVDGKLKPDTTGSVGFTINPLLHTGNTERKYLEYNSAQITTKEALLNAELNAVKSSLKWMYASKDLEKQELDYQIQQTLYSDNKSRYELKDITLNELQDSFLLLSESRKILLEKKQNLQDTEKELYSYLGSTANVININILNIDNLKLEVEAIKNEINIQNGDFLKSSNYQLSSIETSISKNEYNNTWLYDPQLIGKFSLPYNEKGIISNEFTASINYSISLDNFQEKERERAKERFQLALTEKELKLKEAEVNFTQTLDMIETNSINSEIFYLEYEQAKILFSEAKLLFKNGSYSEIELEQSSLFLLEAKNNLFNSLADEYTSWLEFKKYI